MMMTTTTCIVNKKYCKIDEKEKCSKYYEIKKVSESDKIANKVTWMVQSRNGHGSLILKVQYGSRST